VISLLSLQFALPYEVVWENPIPRGNSPSKSPGGSVWRVFAAKSTRVFRRLQMNIWSGPKPLV